MNDKCETYINNGMFLRCVTTVFTLYFLKDTKQLYIVLPIVLTILDALDNTWTCLYKNNSCTKTPSYQNNDKILDVLTYILAYYVLDLQNPILLMFIVARAVGVMLYTLTGHPMCLVI
jgi:hypothetical protein